MEEYAEEEEEKEKPLEEDELGEEERKILNKKKFDALFDPAELYERFAT